MAYVVKPLLDFIAQPESNGRYNAVYGNARSPVDLAQYTLDEVIARARKQGMRKGSSATGRYQMLTQTMLDIKRTLKLSGDALFTPDLQDRMATALLVRRGLKSFLAETLPTDQFAHNLAKEWASLPSGAHNRSYYAGDHIGNRALVEWDSLIQVLRQTRRRYYD